MNAETIKKLVESELIPEKIKTAITEKTCKITTSSITKERVVTLYGLRREEHLYDERYKTTNLQIEKMLNNLKNYKGEFLSMINILSPNIYATIFADETLDQIIGVLDLTGLGNTNSYLDSLFR